MWLMEHLRPLSTKMAPSRRRMRLMERLSLPRVKTASLLEDAWPSGVLRRAVCPRTKKEVAKKFTVRKKTLHRSQHRHVKIACCGRAMRHLPWQRRDTKIQLHLHDGSRWPR